MLRRGIKLLGVPTSQQEITASLNALGVTMDQVADAKLMKKKYIELVKKYHPDTGGDEEKMKTVTKSYEILTGLSTAERRYYSENKQRSQNPFERASSSYAHRGGGANANTSGQGGAFYSSSAAYDWRSTYTQQAAARGNPYGYSSSQQEDLRKAFVGNPFFDSNRVSISDVVFRSLMIYFVVSLAIAIVYRAYRERTLQEGWDMNGSVSMHDRMMNLDNARESYRRKMEELEYQRRKKESELAAQRAVQIQQQRDEYEKMLIPPAFTSTSPKSQQQQSFTITGSNNVQPIPPATPTSVPTPPPVPGQQQQQQVMSTASISSPNTSEMKGVIYYEPRIATVKKSPVVA